MTYSPDLYTGNGATQDYDLTFPYLSKAHITVTVAGVSAPFTWVNASRVRITTVPPAASAIVITRTTQVDSAEVTFQPTQTPIAANLNTGFLQTLYARQEEAYAAERSADYAAAALVSQTAAAASAVSADASADAAAATFAAMGLSTDELDQLRKINDAVISITKWEYLAGATGFSGALWAGADLNSYISLLGGQIAVRSALSLYSATATDTAISSAVAAHAAASDPHTEYVREASVDAAWATILGAASIDFTTLARPTTLSLGASPVIDAAAPGADSFNVTDTTTATSGTDFQNQFVRDDNAGGDSSADTRVTYRRIRVQGAFNRTKVVGGSSYAYHDGSGTITNMFGDTSQILNNSTGAILDANGGMHAVRQEAASNGLITAATGASGLVKNADCTGAAFTYATGLTGTVENDAAGTIADATGVFGELLLTLGTTTTARALWGSATVGVGATLTTGFGLRIGSLANSGTVGTWYGLYIAAPTGTAPTTNHWSFYNASSAVSYFTGVVQCAATAKLDAGWKMAEVRERRFAATIADDTATNIDIAVSGYGKLEVWFSNASNGLIATWDAVGTYQLVAMSELQGLSTIDQTTGVLAGTTGTDGRFTVSIDSGTNKIYFENRMGFSTNVIIVVIEKV